MGGRGRSLCVRYLTYKVTLDTYKVARFVAVWQNTMRQSKPPGKSSRMIGKEGPSKHRADSDMRNTEHAQGAWPSRKWGLKGLAEPGT